MEHKTYSLKKSQILTHRGLEPNRKNFHSESSYEAFRDHLNRGFGIEFDVNFTKDNEIIIFHDAGDVPSIEIRRTKLESGKLCSLGELMELLIKSPSTINALHLKGKFQQKKYLDILLNELQKYQQYLKKILIFDVKPETGKYLLAKNSNLILAPSVAHPFDIKRYNTCVHETLISLEEAIKYKELYNWVWLDEWDRTDKDGKNKKLYTSENFKKLRSVGYKIALITPELHREAHQDAQDKGKLFARIKEIIKLKPDVICTNYPERAITL